VESAICAVTSDSRKRDAAREPVSCPVFARMVETRSGRVLWSAGNMPKSSPVPIASAAAKSTTAGCSSSCRVVTACAGRMEPISASVHRATSRLAIPPSSASRTDSVRSCASTWRRLAPSERRTAISIPRPAPRASSRLAMLAQAMSRTRPVMAKSSVSGVRTSACSELCPRRPGSSVTSLARKRAIPCSLIPSCSGASTSATIGR
jgi:hypothetical protein